jgi:hypothetical protein
MMDSRYKCFNFLNDHELQFNYQEPAKQFLTSSYLKRFPSNESPKQNSQIATQSDESSRKSTPIKSQSTSESSGPKLLKKKLDKQVKLNLATSVEHQANDFEIELEC